VFPYEPRLGKGPEYATRWFSKNEASEWLEKCYQARCAGIVHLKESRHFAPLRLDPRYRELLLLRRVGFPPSAQMMAALAVVPVLRSRLVSMRREHLRRLESWRKTKKRAKDYLRQDEVRLKAARKAEQRGFIDSLVRHRSLWAGMRAQASRQPIKS